MPDKITRVVLEVFATAGGWVFAPSTPDGYGYSWFDAKNVNRGHELPDFLHDLQACVDVLERFCADRKLIWECGSTVYREPAKSFYCGFEQKLTADDADRLHIEHGATPQEAIILAVHKALTKGGET